MAKDYLAMYLALELEQGVTHTIPIMLFDQSPSKLLQGIQWGSYFKTIQEVKDAVHRIVPGNQAFQCTVLLLPFGTPAMGVLFKREESRDQLKLMLEDIDTFLAPPAAPVLSSQYNITGRVQICIGFKNKHTPYPQAGFIDWPKNFKHDRWVFQFQDAEMIRGGIPWGAQLFFTLTFRHPASSQIFFMSMD